MKHFGPTILAGLIFLIAALFAGIIPLSSLGVLRETDAFGGYRETLSVKQGVSQDGQLALTKIPNAPSVPPRTKTANHARTLRAFIAPNRGGALSLFVESVKPHEYYALTGNFAVTAEYVVLAWTSGTTLEFYGVSPSGQLMRYAADVHFLTLAQSPVDPSVPIHTKNVLSGDIVP